MSPTDLNCTDSLQSRIEAALPQTQCTRCGFPDCAAYAQAIATGQAGINQCPPGGAEGVARLAALTGRELTPLSAEHGVEGPRSVAWIDEGWCIGCTLCLDACPTDAIVGTNKRMHTVLEQHCTGCELCIPACPVDCIHLENASGMATGWSAWSAAQADHAHQRYSIHQMRLEQRSVPPNAEAGTTDIATTRGRVHKHQPEPGVPAQPAAAASTMQASSSSAPAARHLQDSPSARAESVPSSPVAEPSASAQARAAIIAAALEKARLRRAKPQG